jgi:osmoprotectant transport system substrate-binding protein
MKWLPLMLIISLLGCDGGIDGLRIGVKDFTEQEILAQIIQKTLTSAGYKDATITVCHDTYQCHQAMRAGRIDVMVDYTGTGLAFRGIDDYPEDPLGKLNSLYNDFGMTWLALLGFDNSYILVTNRSLAQQHKMTRIQDLELMPVTPKIAVPREFLRRPGDGFASMISFHGLHSAEPLIIDDIFKRVEAVLDGRAHGAILYSTDAAVNDQRLISLSDSKGFFRRYEGAIVIRTGLKREHPELVEVLKTLKGGLSNEDMISLNRMVQLEGLLPQGAAAQYIEAQGLASDSSEKSAEEKALVIVAKFKWLEPFFGRVTYTVRAAWPNRRVVIRYSDDPFQEIMDGTARLALLSADEFFTLNKADKLARDERLEVLVAVGEVGLHILEGSRSHSADQEYRAAWLKFIFSELASVTRAPLLPILGEVGNRETAQVIGGTRLLSVTLEGYQQAKSMAPFLRRIAIPLGTYGNKDASIETIGMQIVLAGPRAMGSFVDTIGGPATALPARPNPVSQERIAALTGASQYQEAPDPALPAAWLRGSTANRDSNWLILDSVINILAIMFLVWLALLVYKPRANSENGPNKSIT